MIVKRDMTAVRSRMRRIVRKPRFWLVCAAVAVVVWIGLRPYDKVSFFAWIGVFALIMASHLAQAVEDRKQKRATWRYAHDESLTWAGYRPPRITDALPADPIPVQPQQHQDYGRNDLGGGDHDEGHNRR